MAEEEAMRALLLLLPECCSVPFCVVFLAFAAGAALLAGDRRQSRQIWAVIVAALQIILKGGI